MGVDTIALTSAIAAIVSAVGGVLAAFAAFRSAGLASTAVATAHAAERRAAIRQLTVTASEVATEIERAESRLFDLHEACREQPFILALFLAEEPGRAYESREISEWMSAIAKLKQEALPLTAMPEGLMVGPLAEIAAREVTLSRLLLRVRAVRENVERQTATLQGQYFPLREKLLDEMKRRKLAGEPPIGDHLVHRK